MTRAQEAHLTAALRRWLATGAGKHTNRLSAEGRAIAVLSFLEGAVAAVEAGVRHRRGQAAR